MRLSASESRILGATELRGKASSRELSLLAKMPEHAVHYHLKRLRERGLIGSIKPSINPYCLGLCHYGFFIKLEQMQRKIKDRFVKACIAHDAVVWCAEMGAHYHFAIAIAARDPLEAHAALGNLRRQSGVDAAAVDVVVRLRVESYGRKYLSSGGARSEPLWYGGPLGGYALDPTDNEILKALWQSEQSSATEVSRATGVALTTAARRIKQMEEGGVITGYYREMNPVAFGIQTFNVNLRSNSLLSDEGATALYGLARSHPHIVHAIRTMGAWDFEVVVEALQIKVVSSIIDEISERIRGNIDAQVVPIFQYLKYRPL